MKLICDCSDVTDLMVDFQAGKLPEREQMGVRQHLASCAKCREGLAQYVAMTGLLQGSIEKTPARKFEVETCRRLKAVSTGPVAPVMPGMDYARQPSFAESISDRFGSAPWWLVSVSLHVLAILLASLVTMTIGEIIENDDVIVVTNIEKPLEARVEEEKQEKPAPLDVLQSKVEVPPTDPTADTPSNIIVPPDILAQAEVGDHFETINPDRPDTQSAFGNPDARMFHSVQGNDEPEGGGGSEGNSLMDAMIGLGAGGSPGTGGGWGGGNGTGTGIGSGSGHGSFGNRNGGGRRLMVMRHGGNKMTESAVDKALEWLAHNQEADGHWDTGKHKAPGNHTELSHLETFDTGVTGFAVLAFLGAGHSEKVGKYKENVQRGVKWLISIQMENGAVYRGTKKNAKDGIGTHPFGYGHAIAGLALAEAAAMGRVPETKKAAQKAVDYSVNIHQHRPNGEGSEKLGWRYKENDALGDTSVVGWYVMQLKSAKVAGLHVDPSAFDGAMKYLDIVQVEKPVAGDPYSGHLYGYVRDGGGSRKGGYVGDLRIKDLGCNTAIGCLARMFLGMKPEEVQGGVEAFATLEGYKAAIEKLQKMKLTKVYGGFHGGPPDWNKPNYYYWYYGTLCAFQQGGECWKKWNEAMKKTLLDNQCKGGGADDGSFPPEGPWCGDVYGAGRVMSTALGALCLEVYYRYLPMYR